VSAGAIFLSVELAAHGYTVVVIIAKIAKPLPARKLLLAGGATEWQRVPWIVNPHGKHR
jgi:hypothetical protein